MPRWIKILGLCACVGAGTGWFLTRAAPLLTDVADGHTADPANGALVFAAAGCASCHAAPNSENKDLLAGGYSFVSDFGTFYAPNISWGSEGIAGWTLAEFARAVTKGVSPKGQHYYPAFPYGAYQHMTQNDVSDLFAHLQTLPVSSTPSPSHDVGFPFNVRRGLGLWKRMFMEDDWVLTGELSDQLIRGRYLVEGLAHCAECHTARNALGALDRSAWLRGAPNPSGKGKIPGITPSQLDWSQSDLVYYFESGLTPDYDSVGGSMASVVTELAKLPASDREAIAAYLKALP
ncbi:MAG: cytochrome c [Sulfitobacter sp.]